MAMGSSQTEVGASELNVQLGKSRAFSNVPSSAELFFFPGKRWGEFMVNMWQKCGYGKMKEHCKKCVCVSENYGIRIIIGYLHRENDDQR